MPEHWPYSLSCLYLVGFISEMMAGIQGWSLTYIGAWRPVRKIPNEKIPKNSNTNS